MRYHFDPESQVPIFLIGYSGAGQIAIGAATYLREWTKSPIYVISLGGIFSSDPGLLAASHTFHLWGSRDKAQIWRLLMPGRWSWMVSSEWNRALRQGRASILRMEGMDHTGRGGYLDRTPPAEGARSHLERTVATLCAIIQHPDHPPDTS
jgi:hypothetical protein